MDLGVDIYLNSIWFLLAWLILGFFRILLIISSGVLSVVIVVTKRFNSSLDLNFSFVVDPMESLESFVIDVLNILWWTPYYLPCSAKNCNTKFSRSTQHQR